MEGTEQNSAPSDLIAGFTAITLLQGQQEGVRRKLTERKGAERRGE